MRQAATRPHSWREQGYMLAGAATLHGRLPRRRLPLPRRRPHQRSKRGGTQSRCSQRTPRLLHRLPSQATLPRAPRPHHLRRRPRLSRRPRQRPSRRPLHCATSTIPRRPSRRPAAIVPLASSPRRRCWSPSCRSCHALLLPVARDGQRCRSGRLAQQQAVIRTPPTRCSDADSDQTQAIILSCNSAAHDCAVDRPKSSIISSPSRTRARRRAGRAPRARRRRIRRPRCAKRACRHVRRPA